MRLFTRNLTRAALDWAVAHAGRYIECGVVKMIPDGGLVLIDSDDLFWCPSTDWAQGGPIIEREMLCLDYDKDWVYDPTSVDPDDEPDNGDRWMSWPSKDQIRTVYGPTPLIAAMRCYVASKLGDEVEIPKELT